MESRIEEVVKTKEHVLISNENVQQTANQLDRPIQSTELLNNGRSTELKELDHKGDRLCNNKNNNQIESNDEASGRNEKLINLNETNYTISSTDDQLTKGDDQLKPKSEQFKPSDVQCIPNDDQYIPSDVQYIPSNAQYISSDVQYIPSDAQYIPSNAQYIPNDVQYLSSDDQYIPSDAQYIQNDAQYISNNNQSTLGDDQSNDALIEQNDDLSDLIKSDETPRVIKRNYESLLRQESKLSQSAPSLGRLSRLQMMTSEEYTAQFLKNNLELFNKYHNNNLAESAGDPLDEKDEETTLFENENGLRQLNKNAIDFLKNFSAHQYLHQYRPANQLDGFDDEDQLINCNEMSNEVINFSNLLTETHSTSSRLPGNTHLFIFKIG